MVNRRISVLVALLLGAGCIAAASAQRPGSIRGSVFDADFDAPLAGVEVLIAETGATVTSSPEGNYLIGQVAPGTYTLVFSKSGYVRQIKSNVVVSSGRLTEADAFLPGDFTEMEEFIVQDIQIGAGTEAALLELRFESPALMDSISSDLMSKAGVSDAASALTLVSGATVQEGKFAVIRGLPDRYVNSQMNGVRLPTADEDKRAVQLDQFPAASIESIQISKTFTPDQQGDASGGAVNVVLKSIPEEWTFKVSGSYGYNENVRNSSSDFLSYRGGGVSTWGKDDGGRDIQTNLINQSGWAGPVGVSQTDAPQDYKYGVSGGGKLDFDDDVRFGFFGSFFYERDSSYREDAIDDKYWWTGKNLPAREKRLNPQWSQGSPSLGEFVTSLFDVTQATEEVKWGALGIFGIETENHAFQVVNMFTRTTEDTATLAEDTRGKQSFFPGHDPDDPSSPGWRDDEDESVLSEAPYLRNETLKYTERETNTLQFSGQHTLMDPEFGTLKPPVIDWGISRSVASLNEPDKRQFGGVWIPSASDPESGNWGPLKSAAQFTLGNVQRTWKEIDETSDQYYINLSLPYTQWSDDEGYLKFGYFNDVVKRRYRQDSFSNFGESGGGTTGDFDFFWSSVWPQETHVIQEAEIDVDYDGDQAVRAWYVMADFPVAPWLRFTGGTRFERTEIGITNFPDLDEDGNTEVKWIPPDASASQDLAPGEADVDFSQDDMLPALAVQVQPIEAITLRGSYSETVARQTFKELSPIQQQEFLGADVFVGNPGLKMSSVKNYDARLDIRPTDSFLFSVSYFLKDITDPIEYVQRIVEFSFTTPRNYPEGTIEGYEFEVRQDLGAWTRVLEGLSIGGNATLIDSEVQISQKDRDVLSNINVNVRTRDMLNAPEYLYNAYVTYEIAPTGTGLAVFYTVRGDTLVAGAGQSKGNYIPSVYETEFATLNASLSQKLGDHWSVKFQAKNLLDPDIETVYRHDITGAEQVKTSYQKGMEFSVSLSGTF